MTWRGQGFRTRKEGHGTAHRTWKCPQCRVEFKAKPGKVCAQCQATPKWWLFDSDKELRRARALLIMLDAGEITRLRFHTRMPIYVHNQTDPGTFVDPKIVYVPDSDYFIGDEWVVEDVKTTSEKGDDPVFRLKRRLFEACYGTTLRIVRKV